MASARTAGTAAATPFAVEAKVASVGPRGEGAISLFFLFASAAFRAFKFAASLDRAENGKGAQWGAPGMGPVEAVHQLMSKVARTSDLSPLGTWKTHTHIQRKNAQKFFP